jgi:ABC-type dipeptide/oligopeptide/nickel transport system permease component
MLEAVPGSFKDISQMNLGSGLGGDSSITSSGSGSAGPQAWDVYFRLMKGFFTWDMPYTYQYPQMTVNDIIERGFPVSLTLAVLATLLTLAIAIPLGMLAAARKGRFLDHGPMFTLTALSSLPGYLAAVILILIFSSLLGLLPTGGWTGPKDMIIPVIALALHPTAILARYVRSSILQELRSEYVIAAYAKGASPMTAMTRHVLRNSLIPLVTVVGPMFANLATGTVFIEALMGIPGLGLYFTVAARTRDMPLLLGATMFFAVLLMVMNLLVDLSYRILDPRIRGRDHPRQGRKLDAEIGRTV